MGRRWGKSTLAIDRLTSVALEGYPTMWASPTFRMLGDTWRLLSDQLRPVLDGEPNRTDRLMRLVNRGSIEFFSLDSGDEAGRSRAFKSLVVDEAALVPNLRNVFQRALRPSLTDYRGDAWLLSTPRGLGDFHTFWRKGQEEDDWASWIAPTSENPYIDKQEIEDARRDLSELAFRQEYLGEFISMEGAVFGGLSDAIVREIPEFLLRPLKADVTPAWLSLQEPPAFAIGVDWARSASGDYSVFVVAARMGNVVWLVHVDRFRGMPFAAQQARLMRLWRDYGNCAVLAESNTIGGPNIEALRAGGMRVRGYAMQSQTKARLVQEFVLGLERGTLKVLDNPVLIGELAAFEGTQLPGGAIRYAAPGGGHDDCVIAAMLAYHAARTAPATGPAADEALRELAANVLGGRYTGF